MTRYNYECEKCGEVVERYFSIGKQHKTVKCACGARMAQVILDAPGVVYKGDGWSGKEITRRHEDNSIKGKAIKARKLKDTGTVPRNAVIKKNDPWLDRPI